MFLIKNTSSSDIILDDLRLVLGPDKEIDLDKVAPRMLTEFSEKLRREVKAQKIRILRKDTEAPTVHANRTPSIDQKSLAEMEQRLASKMATKDQQIADLTNAVHMLVKQLANQPAPTTVIQQVQPQGPTPQETAAPKAKTYSTKDGLDDDITGKMHALSMKRIEKKAKGNINQETTTVQDDSLSNNIDELEGLI